MLGPSGEKFHLGADEAIGEVTAVRQKREHGSGIFHRRSIDRAGERAFECTDDRPGMNGDDDRCYSDDDNENPFDEIDKILEERERKRDKNGRIENKECNAARDPVDGSKIEATNGRYTTNAHECLASPFDRPVNSKICNKGKKYPGERKECNSIERLRTKTSFRSTNSTVGCTSQHAVVGGNPSSRRSKPEIRESPSIKSSSRFSFKTTKTAAKFSATPSKNPTFSRLNPPSAPSSQQLHQRHTFRPFINRMSVTPMSNKDIRSLSFTPNFLARGSSLTPRRGSVANDSLDREECDNREETINVLKRKCFETPQRDRESKGENTCDKYGHSTNASLSDKSNLKKTKRCRAGVAQNVSAKNDSLSSDPLQTRCNNQELTPAGSNTLLRRLRSLRNSDKGLAMRLRSGHYCPHGNDSCSQTSDAVVLRKRRRNSSAHLIQFNQSSEMDVTVLGTFLPGNDYITLPAYLHRYSGIQRGCSGNDKYPLIKAPCYSWIMLKQDIIRAHGIANGCLKELRLYNAVVIPTMLALTRSEGFSNALIHGDFSGNAVPMIICTDICEAYPQTLPPLATIDFGDRPITSQN